MIQAVARFILGQLFILASFDKILHPAAFADVVVNYHILPGALVAPVAVILPWVELLCGLALVLKQMVRGAALILMLMLAVFLASQGYNLWRGLDVACGCFTTDPLAEPHAWFSLTREGVLWVLSLVVLFSGSDKRQPD